MSFDIEKIKSLIATAAQAQVDELELAEHGVEVRIQRHAGAVCAVEANAIPAPSTELPAASEAKPVDLPVNAALQIIKATMAGTFYRSVTPGGSALVKDGDAVEAGTVLGVLESMKIMNEIESEQRGRVRRVLCDNGELVKAGQPLFELEEC